MPDVLKWLADGMPFSICKIPSLLGDALSKLSKNIDAASQLAFERWLVAVGTDSLTEAVEIFEKRTVDRSRVECPTSCIVGEGEAETSHNQTQVAYGGLEVPK